MRPIIAVRRNARKQKAERPPENAENTVTDIRQAANGHFSAKEKIRIIHDTVLVSECVSQGIHLSCPEDLHSGWLRGCSAKILLAAP